PPLWVCLLLSYRSYRTSCSFRPCCPSCSLFSVRPIVKTCHHASLSRRFFLDSSCIASHHYSFPSCPSPSHLLLRPTAVLYRGASSRQTGLPPLLSIPKLSNTELPALFPRQSTTSSKRLHHRSWGEHHREQP
ncbi:unnamed protein product, partial [Ectocarpus fasciculatus]